MTRTLIQILPASLLLAGSAVLAQASRPPTLLPDASMAVRQRALAEVMTVKPAAAMRRGDSQVVHASASGAKGCSMSIAPLPDKREGVSKLGTVNQTVVVQGSPILVCGR